MKKLALIVIFLLSTHLIKAQDSVTTLKGLAADTAIFSVIDEEPKPLSNFYVYLLKCIQQVDPSHKTSGMILLKFIVEKDGSLSNIQVVKSLSPFWDAEAIKFLKNAPKWKPGKLNGKIVRSRFSFPVRLAS